MSPTDPPPYGAPPYAAPGPQTSAYAITALVTGILGLVTFACCYGVIGIAGIVLGVLGMREIDASEGAKTGRGMALAGVICGAVGLVLGIALFVVSVATGAWDGVFDVETS